MKICNYILVLIFFLSINNLPICACLKLSTDSKQDAIVSLIIFAKSQADLDRENQLRIMTSQNKTQIDKFEFANLMKKRKSSNLKEMTENVKNNSSHNVTITSVHNKLVQNKTSNIESNKTINIQQNVNKTSKIENKNITNNSQEIKNNETLNDKNENKLKKIYNNNSTIPLKNISTANNTVNLTNKANIQSGDNRKLIML